MSADYDLFDEFKRQLPDIDPAETQDWIDALSEVVEREGPDRARFLLFKVLKQARRLHVGLPPLTQTRYINTISPEQEPPFPGDEAMELRIRRMIRWNAVAMVLRANNAYPGIGGHLATYASAASLYEVGFNRFFRGRDAPGGGDQVFYQGHAAPGIYAIASGPTGRSRPARARASSSWSCPPSTGWPTSTPPRQTPCPKRRASTSGSRHARAAPARRARDAAARNAQAAYPFGYT